MNFIVRNESNYNSEAVGDMKIKCKNGEPVRARGIVQITECYYPHITDQEAFDVDYSLNFLKENLLLGKKNCMQQWTTCRMYYKGLPKGG